MHNQKIRLELVLDKYLIVVNNDERKIVYDIDDSSIFSSSVIGCKRGARNAVLSHETFKTLDEAEVGLSYLNTCHWSYEFKIIKVSELQKLSEHGWNILLEDINEFNLGIDFETENKYEMEASEKIRYSNLHNNAINIIESGHICSIEEDDDCVVTIKVFMQRNTLS